MTHTLNNLRLVKAQVAAQEHECIECTTVIERGERYMRAALPPTVDAFPDPLKVGQEEAWQYVDRSWVIEKTHELCYAKRYFRPVASLQDCGHKRAGKLWCCEETCDSYINKRSDPNQTMPDVMIPPSTTAGYSDGNGIWRASCGHRSYSEGGNTCAEMSCRNYVAKSKEWGIRG